MVIQNAINQDYSVLLFVPLRPLVLRLPESPRCAGKAVTDVTPTMATMKTFPLNISLLIYRLYLIVHIDNL